MTDASADIAPAVPTATRNVMRANKRRDTGREMKVRRWLHARGYRFRLDYAKLPGRPDIVLPRHRLAIFVHGCADCGGPGLLRGAAKHGLPSTSVGAYSADPRLARSRPTGRAAKSP